MAGGGKACVAGETATAADGTHPTGMHSCLQITLKSGKDPRKKMRSVQIGH